MAPLGTTIQHQESSLAEEQQASTLVIESQPDLDLDAFREEGSSTAQDPNDLPSQEDDDDQEDEDVDDESLAELHDMYEP